MRPFRSLAIAAALLACAGAVAAGPRPARPAAPAAPVTFAGFLASPFTLTAETAPAEAADDDGDGLLAECLQTWQLLCRSGALDEAADLVQLMLTLEPQNPQVHAASSVTQALGDLCRRIAGAGGPAPCAAAAACCAEAKAEGCCATGCCAKDSCCAKGCCAKDSCCAKGCCATGECAKGECGKGCTAKACCATGCCAKESCGAAGCCAAAKAEPKDGKSCGCKKGCACCDCAPSKEAGTRRAGRRAAAPTVVVIERPLPPDVLLPALGVPPLPPLGVPCPAAARGEDMEVEMQVRGTIGTAVLRHPPVLTWAVEAPPAAHSARHVHLVTPHLEAHCERMSCQGSADRLLLEGAVRLTCKSNGLLVEAARVVVDMRDGTFAVESGRAVVPTRSQFGAHRAAPAEPTADGVRRSVHVVPVPACPDADEPTYTCPEVLPAPRPLPSR